VIEGPIDRGVWSAWLTYNLLLTLMEVASCSTTNASRLKSMKISRVGSGPQIE